MWSECEARAHSCIITVASFLGHSCLHVLITCSMQKQRRKAWEIRVTCMMSHRRRGWGGGRCPIVVTHNFALISLKSTEQQAVMTLSFEHYSLKFLDKMSQEGPWDSCRAPPPTPHVYLTSRMWLFLPGLLPPFLHTASDQKLEAGTRLLSRA